MTFIIDGQILCLVFKLYLVFFPTEKKNIFIKVYKLSQKKKASWEENGQTAVILREPSS